MGTSEQAALGASANNNNSNNTQNTTQQYAQLPKSSSSLSSPPPQNVVIIPSTQATTVATKNIIKIRRAFTMPRNPFRWSRKFKTATAANAADDGVDDDIECNTGGSNSALTSCVSGGRGRTGSIVSLNSYEAISKDANGNQNVQNINGLGNENLGSSSNNSNNNEIGINNNEKGAAAVLDENNDKIERKIGGKQNRNNILNANATNSTATNTTNSTNRIFRRSSFRKFLNRIAQHVSNTVNIGANKQTISLNHHNHVISNTDRVPPIGGYQWPPDQIPGVMGLKNHGNTCFMNAVLQCLSHTDILAEYFVLDQYKNDLKRRNKINSRKFGTKGELTEQLANVLKALWTCKNESDHSTSFKAVVDRYGSQFRSSTQHDAQEFLFWLLDKVHEDLNTATKRKYKSVKNSYGRPDEIIAAETLANHIRCNNSFVQAVFQAQFRSSLTCPRCRKQSNTFDPFHCISVQLPQLLQQNIFVTVVYLKQQPKQVRLGLRVPAGSPIVALREQLQTDTGIASERMVLVDINKEGFARVFYDTQPIETLKGIQTIYCIEVPELQKQQLKTNENETNEANKNATTTTTANVAANQQPTELLLLVANVRKKTKVKEKSSEKEKKTAETEIILERFGIPFSMQAARDCSYIDLQKKLLREMSSVLKPEVFSYTTPLTEMFQMRLQCPSADPDSYLEQVEHPLLTEMIDMALSVLSAEAGPAHIKLVLEWPEPEAYFADLSDDIVEHESVGNLQNNKQNETQALTLEQCLEHYTKAETLSAEDAWRCPHCQQYLPVVKTLGLWSLPDILIVHFKRFRQHQEKGQNAAKLTTMVNFPLNSFDMSPHLARGATELNNGASLSATTGNFENYRPSPWRKSRTTTNDSRSSTLNSRDNRETRYDLYAVCYHQGDTLETGHYTAACKNPYDHQWYKFDDQRVSKVPNENIQEEIINNEAYMLFYQRRNDNIECSGSSSNSGSDHWVSRLPPPPGATPVPPIEKFTATSEKMITPKAEEAKIIEETQLETAEMKIVDVPKMETVNSQGVDKINEVSTTSITTSKETPAQLIVNQQLSQQPAAAAAAVTPITATATKPNIIDIDKIDFADADEQQIIGEQQQQQQQHLTPKANNKVDQEIITSSTKPKTLTTTTTMTNDKITINETKTSTTTTTSIKTPFNNAKAQSPNDSKSFKIEATIHHAPAERASSVPINGFTNGYKHTTNGNEHKSNISPIIENASTIKRPNSGTDDDSTTSTTSSTSSLSSRSSPHELSTSINGASNLQHKFNGFNSHTYHTTSGAINGHKEAFLSSSLKSNSSSFITTTNNSGGSGNVIVGGNSNAQQQQQQEFQLSRYQRQNWNGSRFSVSAVENATTTGQSNSNGHGLNLRHSFSTSSNYKLRECNETLSSLLRNSANTCSKDTLLFIDSQSHHHHNHHHRHANSLLEDEDDSFMGSRSLWISPVTPHKLITVSPKN